MKLAMFLLLAGDGNSNTEWGDGADLIFYADAKAMSKGRVERVYGMCQGG